ESQGLLTLSMDAIWEIDVFGRVRRQVESEQALFEASIEEYRDVLVTLFAEVALNYIDVRAYQQRILNASKNVETQEASLQLAIDRYKAGLTSKLDVAQARYNLAATKSVIPTLEIGLNYAINRLELLIDVKSDSLRAILMETGAIPLPEELIETGIPADVLRQRPDIRSAERVLASRTADIGVATADLYPTFSISGFFGLSSRSATNLFDASSFTWGFALPFNWAVFDRGRIFSNITVYEERARQSLLHYYNTINKAFEEVDNAIDSYNKYTVRTEYLKEGVEANVEAVELVTIQYDKGLTDFQNVLDTQRSLFQQQDELLQSETQVVVDLVALYKALGGGWDSQVDSTSVPAEGF
ncbi:MAG: TolC family protein, partial [Flavobacteriaceae bacterium]